MDSGNNLRIFPVQINLLCSMQGKIELLGLLTPDPNTVRIV